MKHAVKLSNKPSYTQEELDSLSGDDVFNLSWETNENIPRKVEFISRSNLDMDFCVVRIEGEPKTKLVMACGNVVYDGKITGTDIWVKERL